MGRIEELDARIHERMDAMNKRLADRMAAIGARLGETGNSSTDCLERHCAVARTDNGKDGSADRFVASNDDRWCFADKIMFNMWDMVRTMPLVKDNKRYRGISDSVIFKVLHSGEFDGDTQGDDVNAFAWEEGLNDCSDSRGIYVCSGAMRYARLMSAAYVGSRDGIIKMSFPVCFRDMAAIWLLHGESVGPEFAAKFSEDHGLDMVLKDSLVEDQVDNIALGGLMGVVAHELGHQVYGHCSGDGKGGNREISRNQERDADSFASSITSQSKYKNEMGVGTIIWDLAWAVRDCILGNCNPECIRTSTHPHGIERLLDFVRHNPTTMEAIGWDEVVKLLNGVGIKLS